MALLKTPVGMGLHRLTAQPCEQKVPGTPRHAWHTHTRDSCPSLPVSWEPLGSGWALLLSSNSVYSLVIKLNLLSLSPGWQW